MPIYEYKCNQCEKKSEILVKNVNAEVVCPTCNSSDLVKLISEPGAVMAKGCSASSGDAAPVCPNRPCCGMPGCPH